MDNLNKELKRLGSRLKFFRKEKGFTQERLANKSGLYEKYYSEIERGNRNISFKNLLKITNGLEVSLRDLFDYKDEYRQDSVKEEKINIIIDLLKRAKSNDLDLINTIVSAVIENRNIKKK